MLSAVLQLEKKIHPFHRQISGNQVQILVSLKDKGIWELT